MHVVVRVVRSGNNVKLVEWQEDGKYLRRGWVPNQYIDIDNGVDDSILQKAAPYGLPLQYLLSPIVIETEQLADSIHRFGLWTKEDILRNANDIARAILLCCGLGASRVQTLVREFEDKEEA